jgi:hypothetical protein
MSYYQGDYYRGDAYRGDYYRGDPGLFAFLGKAARGLTSRLTAGVSEAAFGLIARRQQARSTALIPAFRATQNAPPAIRGMIIPGLPGTLDGGGVDGGQLPMVQGVRRRALHWNKAGYVTRGGGTSRWPAQLVFHPRGTEAVPSRRMNVGNARALRHALHRISGFAHLARRVMSFVKPGHGRGRFKFKKRRR